LDGANTSIPSGETYAGIIKCYNGSRSLFPDGVSGKPSNWGFGDIE
jgi:hypothetical protein